MIHVEAQGEGAPVVLLHSGGLSGRQWRRLMAALAPTHQALAVDLLGSGENPPWPDDQPFELSMDADEVSALVLAQSQKVHLVGHSYGGLIALKVATRHPDKIQSIALYDPVAFGVLYDARDEEGIKDLAGAQEDPLFLDEKRGGNEEWLEGFIDYWNGPGGWRALPASSREAFLRVGRKVFYEVRSLSGDRTPRSAYSELKMPVLLLGGARSPMAAQRVLAQLGAAMPQAQTHLLEGAGHMGPITHGKEVNKLIVGHIAGAA